MLDRLAAAGRVFTHAHAHNVVTLPSHANILTGLYPYQHGVRDNSGFRLPANVPTLATRLHDAGWATAAFVAAYPLDSRFGLDRGFDVYDDRLPKGSRETEFVMAERGGGEVVARAREWWRAQAGRHRFLWVHLYEPHAPYAPPEPFATRFREAPYLGEVAAADAFLGPLLDPHLDGREPPALVIVTADHGEALGEHGELTHGLFAYEATLHVPLVLWGAGVAPGRVETPVRHVDLAPTVLAAVGLDVPPELPGRSLLEDEVAGDAYFEALSATLNRGWAPLRGVIRDAHKLIALPLPELYDLDADPAEADNRIGELALARRLVSLLPAESAWPPARSEEPAAGENERLRGLGYLVGSAPTKAEYGPEDDPKTLVPLDRKMHQVIAFYSEGRLEEALPLAREVVAERPSMALGQSLLAQTLLESGAREEALRVMQQARAIGAASGTLLRQLALTLAESGAAADALEVVEPLAEAGDPESLEVEARVFSEAGRQDDARAVLERLLAADPESPTVLEGLALVHLRQRDWAAAKDAGARAVALNPELPRAWNDLGVALYQLGETGPALDAWQRAVDLDPTLWDALYNLGVKAAEAGRGDQAVRALERWLEGAPATVAEADRVRARVLLNRLRR